MPEPGKYYKIGSYYTVMVQGTQQVVRLVGLRLRVYGMYIVSLVDDETGKILFGPSEIQCNSPLFTGFTADQISEAFGHDLILSELTASSYPEIAITLKDGVVKGVDSTRFVQLFFKDQDSGEMARMIGTGTIPSARRTNQLIEEYWAANDAAEESP